MARMSVMGVALLLLAAACGGDSSDGAAETGAAQPAPTEAAATQPDPEGSGSELPTGGGEDGGSAGSGPSTATVTIGDQTYEFSSEDGFVAQCLPDLFGVVSVQLSMVGGDGSVAIVVLHDGTDPEVVGEVNSVEVDLGDEDWVADEIANHWEGSPLQPGMSQVDSAEVDGSTVRGTATFLQTSTLFGEIVTETGTFEATCGEERTS